MLSSWETFDPEDRFKGTALKKRAEKRTVEQWGERAWRVLGERKLGDAYPEYIVTLPVGSRKYECTCYHHGQGHVRKRKMCSHVLATILLRQSKEPEPVEESSLQSVDSPTGGGELIDVSSSQSPWVKEERLPKPARGRGDAAEQVKYRSVGGGSLDYDDILSPQDIVFGDPDLHDPIPDKFAGFRGQQWQAILDVQEHLEEGVKAVMLSAPTGSGKSLVGEATRRLTPGNSVYACTTKSLQDQIQREFPYARTIKGRSNYPTLLTDRHDLTADDCTSTKSAEDCAWCGDPTGCPYRIAKMEAGAAEFPILNIAYFLAETRTGDNSQFKGRDLVIIDEADTLEEQLMGSIELVIGAGLRKQVGVYSLPKKTVPEDWARWFENEILPAVIRHKIKLRNEARTLYGDDVKLSRVVKRMTRLEKRIKDLLKPSVDNPELTIIEDGWVMTGYEGSKDSDATVRFKPVKVDRYAKEALWDKGYQFLLMSATLISPAQMADDLGLESDEWAVVTMDSTFPPERRPVIVDPVAAVTMKNKGKAYPLLVKKMDQIARGNPGVRILVHTVSYELTRHLYDKMATDRVMAYWNSQERERVLGEFLDVDDAILLAPSFDRGIDLPEEDCQVIVIAKTPHGYLGDKQINARLYSPGGQSWYSVKTIRAIVQMTGRGMRSADDWCDSYILDSSFRRLYRDNRTLFPKWWREALVPSVTDPKYKGLVGAARERRKAR